MPRRRRALAYVLTVEMGDSHRLLCGMYYCCHVTATGGNYVDIGVAVAILSDIGIGHRRDDRMGYRLKIFNAMIYPRLSLSPVEYRMLIF